MNDTDKQLTCFIFNQSSPALRMANNYIKTNETAVVFADPTSMSNAK